MAIRPGLTSPTLSARMTASFDRLSGGRLLINVVTGGDPVELEADGLFQDHDTRYAVTDEFLDAKKSSTCEIWPPRTDETAHGGTLFLDEIGDLPQPLQVKLLRALQERQVVRVGSRKTVEIDLRLIAATNVHLEDAVNAGRFREDLYYRLKVAAIELAPLRERPGDILPLAEHF